MQNKLAIIICGPYRYLDLVLKRLHSLLDNRIEYDFFIHIWKEDLGNKVRESSLNNLSAIYHDNKTKVFIQQAPYSLDEISSAIGSKINTHSPVNAIIGMFYSVSMMCSIIKQLPDFDKYTHIFRIRTDIIILDDNFFSKLNFNNNIIQNAMSYGIPQSWISDQLCFADKKSFMILWSGETIQDIYKRFECGNRNPENTLSFVYNKYLAKKTPLYKCFVEFIDYHIVYNPPRDFQPQWIRKAIEQSIDQYFEHPSKFIDIKESERINHDLLCKSKDVEIRVYKQIKMIIKRLIIKYIIRKK